MANMTKQIKIGNHSIGENCPTFIIAEAGSNHNGDLDLAKKMAKKAYEIGCDCIKFQTYTAEEFCADRTKSFTYKSQGKEITVSGKIGHFRNKYQITNQNMFLRILL